MFECVGTVLRDSLVDPIFLSLDEVLETVVATPQATFGGTFLHGSTPAMAAAYLFHLCQNHPFVDGDKRVGTTAAITFLLMNEWRLSFGADGLIDLVLSVASGGTSKRQLIDIFETRCEPQADR